MDKLTFVQHVSKSLSKIYHADGKVSSFPGAKTLTSVEKEVPVTREGLKEKLRLMRLFAKKGFAMMKGPFTKELQKESRRGLSDRDAPTRTIILDFDGIEIPGYEAPEQMGEKQLKQIAEMLVNKLPLCFHQSSYIATASSSMGVKRKKLGLHVEFWLTDAIAPKALKQYLEHLNFTSPFFTEQLRLTDKQAALSYRIDINLAENSRMVYIAPPNFELVDKNPFKDNKDRIILVEKDEPAVNLTLELLQVKSEWTSNTAKEKYETLYFATNGVKPKKAKLKRIQLASGITDVRLNPNAAIMTMAGDYGDYCSFNVNDGDSGAYFVRKSEPEIVRNFKGEENFLFKEADKETYDWFVDEYLATQEEETAKKSTGGTDLQKKVPFAYISRSEDTVKYGYYCQKSNELEKIYPTKLGSKVLEDWFSKHGKLIPEQLPFVEEIFAPQDRRTVDLDNDFINLFRPNPVFWSEANIPEEAVGADMDSIQKLKLVAPTIYDLIQHMTCGGEEFPRFINWLAAVFQKRNKMLTAWVIHGVQGTGKGSLTDKVLKPIFDRAVKTMNVKTLSEQYNAWLKDSLLVTVEEFKNAHADHAGQMNNRLKEYITEYHIPIRAMRRDHIDVKNYANFIFFSNEHDAVYIEDSDRRFNVCPRQEIKIMQRYPDWKKRVEKDIPKELEGFVRFMQEFRVDMDAATTALENAAKKEMQESSRRSQDSFVHAIRTGDLSYFTEVLEVPMGIQGAEDLRGSKNAIKTMLRDYKHGEETAIFNYEMRAFYNVLIGNTGSTKKFGKMLSRLGLNTTKPTRNGMQNRGVKVVWRINDLDRQRLITQHKIDKEIINAHTNSMEEFVPPSEKEQEKS